MPGSFTPALRFALGNRLARVRNPQRFPDLVIFDRLLKAAFFNASVPDRLGHASARMLGITFVPVSHLVHHI
jgi:hypothetical protein